MRTTTALTAQWAEPVELESWRVLDDPLGIRAAGNALAAEMFTPITSRTSSVRQLGLVLCCARWAQSGNRGHRFDVADLLQRVRAVTVALSSPSLVDLRVRRYGAIRTLPGRTRARRIAADIEAGRGADLRSALLRDEASGGLWGRYGTMARRLGFVRRSGSRHELTAEGVSLAKATNAAVFPRATTWKGLNDVSVTALRVAASRSIHSGSWPLSSAERRLFVEGLTRTGAWPRLKPVFELSRTRQELLLGMQRDERLATCRSPGGDRVSQLAALARMAEALSAEVEDPFRARLRGVDESLAVNLDPYRPLIAWAGRRQLELGRLEGSDGSMPALERHHERVFRRRGRQPWTTLPEERRPLEIPERGAPLELRIGAVVSMAREIF